MKTPWIVGIGAVVVGLWVFAGFGPLCWFPSLEYSGAFGDTFGAVASLFSGLAFAGLIVAICLQRSELQLQREELTLQRKELELTRAELARSAEAQQASAKAATQQAVMLERAASLNALHSVYAFVSADLDDLRKRQVPKDEAQYTEDSRHANVLVLRSITRQILTLMIEEGLAHDTTPMEKMRSLLDERKDKGNVFSW